jgi:hypothetical protein
MMQLPVPQLNSVSFLPTITLQTVMNVKFVWHFSMQEVSGHSVTAGSTVT